MANEATLQAKIIKLFWTLGIYCRKMRSESIRGFPDLIAVKDGHTVYLEVKHPNGKGKLSEDQIEEIALLREHGARVHVVESLEEADHVARIEFNAGTECGHRPLVRER